MGSICFSVVSLTRSLHRCLLSLSVEPFRFDRLWLLLSVALDGYENLKVDGLGLGYADLCQFVDQQHWDHLGTFWKCRLSGPIQTY